MTPRNAALLALGALGLLELILALVLRARDPRRRWKRITTRRRFWWSKGR
jgi:predicted CDP-diglyceride synthetase/phosphatidate cytidylyltransferase